MGQIQTKEKITMTDLFKFLADNYVEIFAAAGALVSAATLITALTPSKKDDEVVSKIRKVLDFVSLRMGN